MFLSLLANPIVLPMYANPGVWLFAVFAICVEILVVMEVLQLAGLRPKGLELPLLIVQMTTWLPFLIAMEWSERLAIHPAVATTVLECAVIAAEVPLIRAASRGWFRLPGLPKGEVSRSMAFRASLLGNLVSIAVSFGPLILAALCV